MATWRSDPPGRVTPGGLLAVLGIAGIVWHTLQPQEQQPGLVCRPVNALVQWMTADDAPESAWAQKIAGVMTRLSERCAETVGRPAAALAEKARTTASQVLTQAKTVTKRQIEEVTGPDRLRIAGLGETRLLGIMVAAEQRDAAVTYLQQTVTGKRLAVTTTTGRDPERRPLVVVTLPDGSSVNAQLIQHGLASPWKKPGPWRQWGPGSPASGR